LRNPNLFILGAPKCGTTSLAAYLDQHPDVVVSTPKETQYFLTYRDIPRLTHDQYLSCFSRATQEAWLCDATPDYLQSEESVAKIAAYAPQAKYVVAIRPHADLAFSLHQQMLVSGTENIVDFEEAWRASEERMAGKRLPAGFSDPERYNYKERLRIGAHLMQTLKHVDRGRIFFVDFEALRQDSEQVMRELFEFLGVAPFTDLDLTPQNLRKEVFRPALPRIGAFLFAMKKRVGLRKSWGIAGWIGSLGVRVAETRPKIPEKIRNEIARDYADDWKLVIEFARSGPGCLSSLLS
jgi:hypothetical protein